jgi:putative sigma-54 modulation protein
MRTIVKGKNLDVTDEDRAYVQHKMLRLERLLDDRSDALVELSVERHKKDDESHIVEVTLVIDGVPLRGVGHGPSHHAAADMVIDKLERRAVDHKQRPRVRSRGDDEKALLRTLADGTPDPRRDGRPNIVKLKRFAIEPMFEEDAVTRMEELGHSFFVFVNAENERVAVLYRRNDGNYGLIEPAVADAYSSGNAGNARGR